MTQILLLLLLFTILFMGVLWPVKKAAQWWGAERSGYGSAAIALAVSMLATLLPQIILEQYLSPLILIVINIIITAGIYASILGTNLLRGLGITVVSAVTGLIILVVMFLLAGVLGIGGDLIPVDFDPFVDQEQQAADIEQAANRVCDCKSDRSCQQKRFAELTILIAQQGADDLLGTGDYQMGRARACVNHYRTRGPGTNEALAPETNPDPRSGGPSESTKQQATQQTPDTGSEHRPMQSPITIIKTPHKARWRYRRIDMSEADTHLYETVRVTRRDNGKVIEGKLTPAKRDNTLALRQRRYSGTFIMEIPKTKIRKLELRESSSSQ